MGEKKDPGVFTIKFNIYDSRHLQVINILESQGKRNKAPYIVNAILHYINCGQSPSIPQDSDVLRQTVESIVQELLNRQSTAIYSEDQETQKSLPKKVRQSEDIGLEDNIDFNDDIFKSVQHSLNLFRKE